uniref:Uncharacterized protein n=1 Tax=Brassica oleracea var. oleracea TaxID=109376 RepID=A0A0D3BY36_BRAOL
MTTTQTERWLDALEKDQQILGEKLNGIQAGMKDVLDQILRLTEMVAAIQVSTMSEVSQETSTDFLCDPYKKKQCIIKTVDGIKDQATEVSDITEGEVVIFKLQPQVSVEQQHKLVSGNQQVLTDIPPHLDFDEDEDDFIVLEGRALE